MKAMPVSASCVLYLIDSLPGFYGSCGSISIYFFRFPIYFVVFSLEAPAFRANTVKLSFRTQLLNSFVRRLGFVPPPGLTLVG